MARPLFNNALGAAALTLQSRPPARFEGVTARVFPLRANMYRLRTFCDSYLNVAPEIVEFRPLTPFVLLMVLDYGKMAAEFANMGWVSQREVAFAVPLGWYDKTADTRFQDFAAVCPFIYVDDETSLSTGRQVYGWPKARVWASREVQPWVYNPLGAHDLLTLSTMVSPELYAGERQEPRVLLEVVAEDLSPFSRLPVDPSRPPNPFSMIPQALEGYLSLFGSWFEMMARPPMLGYGNAGPAEFIESWMRLGTMGLGALTRNPSASNITLKQFRDSREPDYLCYQALVNSTIRTERFNAGGMLGDRNLLLGDPSGGFRIHVHRYDAQPIVEALGLEVSRQVSVGESSVAVLKPLFPFWVDVDLDYGVDNRVLCWRTKESPWHVGDSEVEPGTSERAHRIEKHRFNTTLAGALQGVAGPFDFPDVTMRVLPLLAEEGKLKALCEAYLSNEHFSFEPWGRYVYLVATNYEKMSSETNNIGWWADRELIVFVPVKQRSAGGRLLSVGVVPVFPFVNTTMAAISGSEVQGWPTLRAELDSPPDAWMFESGPSDVREQSLLTCRANVLPALGLGQKSRRRLLVEIKEDDALPYAKGRIAAGWGLVLLAEHRRLLEARKTAGESYDVARALSLEILAHRQPINHITLKQFRDAEDPDYACYQSIIRTRRMLDNISDIREIDDLLHVHVTQQPTQPIVELLGLVPKWSKVTREGRVDVFQPLRPFWMKASVLEELGETLCWRAGRTTWERDPKATGEDPDHYFESEERAHVGLGVLAELGTRPEQYGYPMRRQHLRATAGEFLRDAPEEHRLTRAEAREAIERIEPQMVIESILSAEWEHWGSPRWYERGHDGNNIDVKPDFCIRTDSVGEAERLAVRGTNTSDLFEDGWASEDGLWYSADPEASKARGPALKGLRRK